MPKIGIISQARMGSSRLPGKVLMYAGGKTLLDWHFLRLRECGFPVILATTDMSGDDLLSQWAAHNRYPCFRGSEKNVRSRYYHCAQRNKLDIVVRVTSDCPLIDGSLIADGINQYMSTGESRHYLTNSQSTYPRGFDFEIFSFELLEEANRKSEHAFEREHVTPYFYHKKKLDIRVTHYHNDEDNSHLRVTVDTPDDFKLVTQLIEKHSAGVKTHREITRILKNNPDLISINEHIVQKRVA